MYSSVYSAFNEIGLQTEVNLFVAVTWTQQSNLHLLIRSWYEQGAS